MQLSALTDEQRAAYYSLGLCLMLVLYYYGHLLRVFITLVSTSFSLCIINIGMTIDN